MMRCLANSVTELSICRVSSQFATFLAETNRCGEIHRTANNTTLCPSTETTQGLLQATTPIASYVEGANGSRTSGSYRLPHPAWLDWCTAAKSMQQAGWETIPNGLRKMSTRSIHDHAIARERTGSEPLPTSQCGANCADFSLSAPLRAWTH